MAFSMTYFVILVFWCVLLKILNKKWKWIEPMYAIITTLVTYHFLSHFFDF
ncbi:hypothetical protein Xekk_02598 [Xenorhabdus sp. KK7.4]|nr:hypothetical protein Xekk_02598 [Xenorhabdus sp. KK7.4]